MERLTKLDKEIGGYQTIDNADIYYTDIQESIFCGNAIDKLGKLEDVLEKYGIESVEELDNVLNKNDNILMANGIRILNDKNKQLETELAELKQNAIVLPFEFDKPFYKLCPKCNDQQINCEHCAWGRCGFNQCYDICHKENKGQIIYKVIFKKDNCNVSWNAICFISEHWGEYYFATKEEAEQKLAEIKGEKDE